MDTLRGVAASLLVLTFLHIVLSSDAATGRAAGALSKVGTALGRITDPTVPLFGPRAPAAGFAPVGGAPGSPTGPGGALAGPGSTGPAPSQIPTPSGGTLNPLGGGGSKVQS